MKHEIIKTENYLLAVDDSEIKEGDYHVAIRIVKTNGDKAIAFTDQEQLDAIAEIGGAKKIIAHLPLNGSPILEGVDLLPQLENEVDVDKLAFGQYGGGEDNRTINAFIDGYNQSLEDNKERKYTEEDVRKAMFLYSAWITGGTPSLRVAETAEERREQIIQSLSQPKMPIWFECEMKFKQMPDFHKDEPKTTTNPKGQAQWAGKYIY